MLTLESYFTLFDIFKAFAEKNFPILIPPTELIRSCVNPHIRDS